MKTDNVPSAILSFEDLQDHAVDLFDSWDLDDSETLSEFGDKRLFERFIRTFLEWDLYDEYVYCNSWDLDVIITTQIKDTQIADLKPCVEGLTYSCVVRVDTLDEAEVLAEKKIRDFLGSKIHLQRLDFDFDPEDLYWDLVDHLYRITDFQDHSYGTVLLAKTKTKKTK